jgi:hypothetical protein
VYKARLKQSLEFVVVKACSKDLKPRVLQEVRCGWWQAGLSGWVPLYTNKTMLQSMGVVRLQKKKQQLDFPSSARVEHVLCRCHIIPVLG